MSDMLNALIAAGALPETNFGASSRYYGLPVLEYRTPDGRVLRYVRRRFIPQPSAFPTLVSHNVQQGDRIDTIAARYLGDPLLYWRIVDANLGVRPGETLVDGQSIRIPLPATTASGLA
ncbi:MAG TPA: tail protein X [Rhodopila sp.]